MTDQDLDKLADIVAINTDPALQDLRDRLTEHVGPTKALRLTRIAMLSVAGYNGIEIGARLGVSKTRIWQERDLMRLLLKPQRDALLAA